MQTTDKGAENNATEKATGAPENEKPKTEKRKLTPERRAYLDYLHKQPNRGSPPDVRHITITVDLRTYARIRATQNRSDTFPAAVRRLLHMGLAEYERNARAGIHTAAQRAQQQAERDAQADAMQAERERQQESKSRRKRTRTAQPAAPAVLYLSGIPTTSTDTTSDSHSDTERSNTDAEQANSSPKP